MTEPLGCKKIYPVLLAGGVGVRLWPMSRERFPKQFLKLVSDRTMLQDTALRVADPARFAPPLVICNEEHRFIVAEQFREAGLTPAGIVLEPVGRNTAAAVAVAALQVAAVDPEGLMLVLPADHLICDVPAFHTAVEMAARAAGAGYLVTFGITPTAPEAGYGYIRTGAPLEGLQGVRRVTAFVEKPSREKARVYIDGGEHVWNSGMFLLPVAKVLSELERFEPAVLEACHRAIAGAAADLNFLRLESASFRAAPSTSLDTAVMERTDSAAVVPTEIGWADVGAWSALWEVGQKDDGGNVGLGDVLSHDNHNCYLRSEGPLIAAIGLEDVIVVATEDVVMVAARDQVAEVKTMVEGLKQQGRPELVSPRKVHRPWGFYQPIHAGERFQVKRLTVNPGAQLSLQLHYHRAEHWVVVNGTARVTRGEEQVLLRENESIFIPLGIAHRLENPGRVPLNIIEVQSGSYVDEDDIVRLSDIYGRA